MPPPLNLHADNGSFFIAEGRMVERPAPGATDHDLSGYHIHPGLVNAHDHLELSHYPRTKFREVYANAHQWGEDVNKRLKAGLYADLRAHSIWDRCFIGGLKNLLSGVTTIAHHGPLYKPLQRRDFPINVLQRYGWAHSLHFDTPEQVKASYDATPPDAPWFIHLAEGTDEIAAGEYQRLKALGCVGPNTVIVHGVGMTDADMSDAAHHARGLVWCPTTNHYLLGKTTEVGSSWDYHRASWRSDSHIALGSDSRLTADGDLLAEIPAAWVTSRCDVGCTDEATSNRAAHVMGLDDVGHLQPGARADLVMIGRATRLSRSEHPKLVMVEGVPMIGSPSVMGKFKQVPTIPVTLDGHEKRMNARLAHQYQRCKLDETGLVLDEPVRRRFWF
jgi:cytosine/adenosine deaminase-related metal-dependent hydrolase